MAQELGKETARYALFQAGQAVLRLDTFTGKTWVLQLSGHYRRWLEIREPDPPGSMPLLPGATQA